jgi:hypothetical protein
MARTNVKRKDGEAWFAEEKFGQEVYHAKVGDHKIAVAIGHVATTPIKNAEKRREHISKVVADNVQRFFLSKYEVKTICNAFGSIPSKMGTTKFADWIESQRGQKSRDVPRAVMLEARRRFGVASEELLFGQFETAVGRQVRLSPQEWEAFRRLAEGMLQKQIAGDMKSVAPNNYLRKGKTLADSQVPARGISSDSQDPQGLSEEHVRKVVRAMRQKSGLKGNTQQAVLWFLGFEFVS